MTFSIRSLFFLKVKSCAPICWVFSLFSYVFFFQAEDGIRDSSVTGVQKCALPICVWLNQHPFPMTVARAKRKVSDTIEDGAAPIDFKRLKDMWVVTDYCVRTAIHGIVGFGSVFRRRLPLIGDTPVERDDNPIHLVSAATNADFESIWEIRRAARTVRC